MTVRAQQIKIEVTERGFIDVPKTTPVIQAFRQAGYEVAIDDFGTGYSNLHNLYSLNVDILKNRQILYRHLNDQQHQSLDRRAYYRDGTKPAA
jgi:Predicted signal transduction protein containing sensor and EAL domains